MGKIIGFWFCTVLLLLAPGVEAQVNCNDYEIVAVYDLPASPQAPGGNYFICLLSLRADHPNNFDNYANLYFVDHRGDTLSIPTGPNQILPRFASDTIPYILELKSNQTNPDFPTNFDGELVIIHANQLECRVAFRRGSLSQADPSFKNYFQYYPNPIRDRLHLQASRSIIAVELFDLAGKRILQKDTEKKEIKLDLTLLKEDIYLIRVLLKGGQVEEQLILKEKSH